ncbi:sensor histidine kinase [Kineococcus rubinsiae]|uniref:sensor histidine kinase n=1 Tax=Kineococcus rubinsiae TaxID=2609562 RepID=UPI00142FD7DC|nr:histidine kinase [Kineococcus rubinsiae]NIZ90188.1 hypothetical protein [Kineococcus rubinsiae]
MRRAEPVLLLLAALLLTLGPLAGTGWPGAPLDRLAALATAAGACTAVAWRRHPAVVVVVGPLLVLSPLATGYSPPDTVLIVLLAFAALAAERFGGRAAWLAAAGLVGCLAAVYAVTGDTSPGVLVLVLPGFAAGTVLRWRRRTAEQLAERARELERERDLFATVSVDNERARIATELHDIVGHALSVAVVQAAAGQRLLDSSPDDAREALDVIAASVRQGRVDLRRLVELLGGDSPDERAGPGPDFRELEETIARAARSGLRVTWRVEGVAGVAAAPAHVAFRVVQEGLTNALRHAPGSTVRVLLQRPEGAGDLLVRVENAAPPAGAGPDLPGGGRGLRGLRERVLAAGGSFTAGPDAAHGWSVEARLPVRAG